MTKSAKIAVIVVVLICSALGLLTVVGTLIDLSSIGQIKRLISFNYMSFVDGLEVGGVNGVANDFFTGIALLLIGTILLTRFERTRKAAGIVAGGLFLFVAFCLVYACLNPRIGIRPF